MRWGNLPVGAGHLPLEANTIYLFEIAGGPLDHDLVVGSIAVHLDGGGAGSGQQALRPVVVEVDGAGPDPPELLDTFAVGDEVLVEEGQPAAWTHLAFDMPPTLPAGRYMRLGVAAGPADQVARVSTAPSGSLEYRSHGYAYGTLPVVLEPTEATAGLSVAVVAIGVEPWRIPVIADDDIAGLPIDVAQRVLDGGGVVDVVESAVCGWHYSNEVPPPPASAIVRTGGPLAHLVGERVRVIAATAVGPASIAVVVVDEQPFDATIEEDISLARDAFMRLGPLWADTRDVRVEVLS